jgi:ParB family chromosome partitioning protein
LGRGLDALIPTNDILHDRGALAELPIAAVRPNARQPRTYFDEEALTSLTESVREIGVLQPILVRRAAGAEGQYEVIAGERRWRAARRAGLATVPAIIRTASDSESLEQALIENLNREELNPLEEAAGYQQLIEDFNLTHEELSARVGRSRTAITNALRLFQLPAPVQRLVAEGNLSAGHARALLGTPDRAFQEALARRAVSEQLSVRAVEEAVRERNQVSAASPRPDQPKTPARLRPPGILELEELLADHLSTKVRVNMGAKRGKVVIEFVTLEDLERIYKAMTEPSTQ